MKETICIVTPRYGPNIVGGSESLSRRLAINLSKIYNIEVVTTSIGGYEQGQSTEDDVTIHRFNRTIDEGFYSKGTPRNEACNIPGHPDSVSLNENVSILHSIKRVSILESQRFMRDIGHYSESLIEFLRENSKRYKKVLFTPYLYSTTVEGSAAVPADKVMILLAAHNEPMLYYPCLYHYFRYNLLVYFEQEISMFKRAQSLDGVKINYSIVKPICDIVPSEHKSFTERDHNKIVFLGRAGVGKGFGLLIPIVEKYRNITKHELKLYVIGEISSEIKALCSSKDWIVELGQIDNEEERFSHVSSALALINPSTLDSFGLVNLEAARLGTPVLLNIDCPAFGNLSHISGGAFLTFKSDDSNDHFIMALSSLRTKEMWEKHSDMLLKWANEDYSEQSGIQSFIKAIESK